ncbi:hypothetical protein RclHR1_21290002 [Rhizophagus clarus]|uniref:Uncharacterized protein n=1 Tax=Rhizophagus clarus TaxID=94130 RepID=A0A2Z6QSR8_9GLOM|nr:hypothetical protein RclHR1_21290002 [Rhizophagus clarus]
MSPKPFPDSISKVWKSKSETPFRGGPLSPEEMDLSISKAWNSNSKRTETRKLEVLLTPISKISKRNFEGPEPLLRQTSYLKAHNFLDANKRWGRIKVKVGSKKLKLFIRIEPTGTIFKPLTT